MALTPVFSRELSLVTVMILCHGGPGVIDFTVIDAAPLNRSILEVALFN